MSMHELKNNLIISDVDGTIFRTEMVNFLSYKFAFEKHGYNLEFDEYMEKMFGKFYKQFIPVMIKGSSNEVVESIHDVKKCVYKDYLSHATLNEHLINIFLSMKSQYYLAIVSTACKENTIEIMKRFDIFDIFDLIITQEDVHRTKPDPEGFLKAIDYFRVEAKNTLIFEDSDVGIQAALKTGASILRCENF